MRGFVRADDEYAILRAPCFTGVFVSGVGQNMFLHYQNKAAREDILGKSLQSHLVCEDGSGVSSNRLIRGENSEVLRHLLCDSSVRGRVDLVYIDPPFSTNTIFRMGKERANTVSSSRSDSTAYADLLRGTSFLEFLRERLILIRELMCKTASIYLHIDYKVGHYVKIIMDEVFGAHNFRNDITRIKCNPKNFRRRSFGNVKDLILFYTKSARYTWNEPRAALREEDLFRLFKKVDKDGRRYTTVPLHAPGETRDGSTGEAWRGIKPAKGRHWRRVPKVLEEWGRCWLVEWSANGVPRKKIFADEANGKRLQDIWEFKDPQYPSYPTEKNLDLLKLIVSTSSNEGDLVLDCFCGSGTTLLAAEQLGRNWIGVDQSEQAIAVARKRLAAEQATVFRAKADYDFLRLAPSDA